MAQWAKSGYHELINSAAKTTLFWRHEKAGRVNRMKQTVAIIGIIVLLFGAAISQEPQPGSQEAVEYSESAGYTPRVIPQKEPPLNNSSKKKSRKKKKKKENDKEKRVKIVPEPIKELSIPVSVFTKKGAFIAGLKRKDFKLYVNGAEKGEFEFLVNDKPQNILLLIDISPSTLFKQKEIKEFAQTMVRSLQSDDKIWIGEFDRKFKIISGPKDKRAETIKRIQKLSFGDGTSVYEAVENVVTSDFGLVPGHKTLVFITDGVDTTSSQSSYKGSLRSVETNEISVFPIYLDTSVQYAQSRATRRKRGTTGSILGDILAGIHLLPTNGQTKAQYELGRAYLGDLVHVSGGRPFEFEWVSRTPSVVMTLVTFGIRPMYLLRYPLRDADRDGKRLEIKVRVNRPNLVVTSRGSFIAGQGPKGTN